MVLRPTAIILAFQSGVDPKVDEDTELGVGEP